MRVVIADDALLIREGLTRVLVSGGIEVVEQVQDVAGLMRAVALHSPDTAIADIRMPPGFTTEGIKAAEEIGRKRAEASMTRIRGGWLHTSQQPLTQSSELMQARAECHGTAI